MRWASAHHIQGLYRADTWATQTTFLQKMKTVTTRPKRGREYDFFMPESPHGAKQEARDVELWSNMCKMGQMILARGPQTTFGHPGLGTLA